MIFTQMYQLIPADIMQLLTNSLVRIIVTTLTDFGSNNHSCTLLQLSASDHQHMHTSQTYLRRNFTGIILPQTDCLLSNTEDCKVWCASINFLDAEQIKTKDVWYNIQNRTRCHSLRLKKVGHSASEKNFLPTRMCTKWYDLSDNEVRAENTLQFNNQHDMYLQGE